MTQLAKQDDLDINLLKELDHLPLYRFTESQTADVIFEKIRQRIVEIMNQTILKNLEEEFKDFERASTTFQSEKKYIATIQKELEHIQITESDIFQEWEKLNSQIDYIRNNISLLQEVNLLSRQIKDMNELNQTQALKIEQLEQRLLKLEEKNEKI